MAFTISLSKKVQKDLRKLSKQPVYSSIIAHLRLLAQNPYPLQSKKMVNYQEADYLLRIGDYRVLYSVDPVNQVVLIAGVFHRQRGY